MKYIINGRFLSQRITGVQRYAREIVSELDKICADLDIEIAVPGNVDEIPFYTNIKIIKIGKRTGVLWEQTTFSRYVKKHHAISVNLCNSMPLSGRKIVAIHDVKVKAHPEFFSWKFRIWYNFLFKNAVKKADTLITVSEFSKQEIIKYYRCDQKKIHVIYNAWQHYSNIPIDTKVLDKFGLQEKNYYFALGSLDPNKNLKWILSVAKQHPESIFAIGGGINRNVFAKENLRATENVKFLGYLSDTESKSLMHYCKAFLFPSFYEGFGIPPMEAMVAGAPRIVVSDIPVMHEIFDSCVEYVDPCARNYFEDCNAGKNSFQYVRVLTQYSWEKSAQSVFDILKFAFINI